jgi:hypothetical protein
MKIYEKYLEALKTFDDWVIVSEWAKRFGELNPDLLEKANKEAEKQVNETTGLKEIAARIGSRLSTGGYVGLVEIDTSERPRKVRYIPEDERSKHEIEEVEEDVAPLKRDDIIKIATESMSTFEKYRAAELDAIAKQLKMYFGLDFEVDHAKALLNKVDPGQHHPDNLQLILKAHNSKKNIDNWDRFSIDEQIEYIESAIKLQQLVASRFNIEMVNEILGSLIERLKKVY